LAVAADFNGGTFSPIILSFAFFLNYPFYLPRCPFPPTSRENATGLSSFGIFTFKVLKQCLIHAGILKFFSQSG
jgi:hypothetical protein